MSLLGARHVPEHLCDGSVYLGCYNKCLTLTFSFISVSTFKPFIACNVYYVSPFFTCVIYLVSTFIYIPVLHIVSVRNIACFF